MDREAHSTLSSQERKRSRGPGTRSKAGIQAGARSSARWQSPAAEEKSLSMEHRAARSTNGCAPPAEDASETSGPGGSWPPESRRSPRTEDRKASSGASDRPARKARSQRLGS